MKPKISLISVNDDHPPDLKVFFDALLDQDCRPEDYELIFVEVRGSKEYETAAQYIYQNKPEGLNFIFETIENGSRAKGYNKGIELSSGEVIIFFGDDYIAPPTLISSHYTFHQQHSEDHFVGIGAGILREKEFQNHFSVWLEESGGLYGVPFHDGMDEVSKDFFYIGNASIKRSFLEKAGLFNELYPYHTWEDYELSLRLIEHGMHAKMVVQAQAEHMHDISLLERCKVMAHSGYSAKIHDEAKGEKGDWSYRMQHSLLRYLAAFAKRYTFYAFTRDENNKILMYHAILNGFFKFGYQFPKLTRMLF